LHCHPEPTAKPEAKDLAFAFVLAVTFASALALAFALAFAFVFDFAFDFFVRSLWVVEQIKNNSRSRRKVLRLRLRMTLIYGPRASGCSQQLAAFSFFPQQLYRVNRQRALCRQRGGR
jgi:hypothetical protein